MENIQVVLADYVHRNGGCIQMRSLCSGTLRLRRNTLGATRHVQVDVLQIRYTDNIDKLTIYYFVIQNCIGVVSRKRMRGVDVEDAVITRILLLGSQLNQR